MRISVSETPSAEDKAVLSQGIQAFNADKIPDLEPATQELAFHTLTHDGDQLVGGLRALCYWNTLHIELLWIAESARGKGIGTRLLTRAENHAKDQGYALAHVETTNWQARPFYERHGYELLATLEGRPKSQASHFMSKKL